MASKKTFDVMISYHQKSGTECMEKILKKLENMGYSVWIDKREVDYRLHEDIAKGVDSSFVMIALLSEGYEKSEFCMDELRHAKELKKEIIPVKVSNFDLPGHSPLSFILNDRFYCKMYGEFDDIERLIGIVHKRLQKCKPGYTVPEEKSTQESVTKENQKYDKAAASETEERINEQDATRASVDEPGTAYATGTDRVSGQHRSRRSDVYEHGRASPTEADGVRGQQRSRRSDVDEPGTAYATGTDRVSGQQRCRRSDVAGDETRTESFDVILSFDLTTGREDKSRVFNFLIGAGLSVCDCSEKKLFEFPEYWADRMAGSSVVILLVSSSFSKSKPCMQQLRDAKQARKKIIAINTERLQLHENSELEKLLSDVESYMLYKDFEANMNKVVEAVKQHMANTDFRKENGNKTSEKDESFSKSESSQQYGMGSNSEEHRKATEDRNSRENNSNYTSENFESNTSNTNNGSWMTTINVMSGGIVVLGDRAVINTSNAAPQQSHKTGEENVFSKRSRFSNKSYRTSVQEPSNSSVPVRRDPRVCTPLSAEEALKQGLERYTSEFHEDFRDELAAKLGNHSGIVANWVDVARALKLESKAIQRIEDKGTAHRLLFMKVRDCQPELKLSEIKDILENKMKRKPRRDIFYDYEKNKDLPSLDNKIGDLSDNEFEMVLENVADRLVTERVRGNWRNLGGFLGFTPPELDEIMNEGRPENFTGSARMFIDFLGYRFKKVREVVGALESDQVKRQDLALFMREHLKRDDCWIESCALQSHNKSKTP